MEHVSLKDRKILRELAERKLSFAHCRRNEEILAMWHAQAKGVRDTPPVRLLFSNFPGEVVTSRLRCEGEAARRLEAKLLSSMVGRELFDDDTPISDRLEISLFAGAYPFGARPDLRRAKGTIGFHIEPLTDDIEEDFKLFEGGSFSANPDGTNEYCAWVDEIIGDILPTKIVKARGCWIDAGGGPGDRIKTKEYKGIPSTNKKERSKTFPGIAHAMAEQWGADGGTYQISMEV